MELLVCCVFIHLLLYDYDYIIIIIITVNFRLALRPNACHDLLILEVSKSHSQTHYSVGLIWTRDQLVEETSTSQHTSHDRQTFMHPVGFEPTIPASKRPQTYALLVTSTATLNKTRFKVPFADAKPSPEQYKEVHTHTHTYSAFDMGLACTSRSN
jgi:hypothetical protein